MILGITSISVAVITAIIYVIVRLKCNRAWGVFMALFASYAFIAAGILAMFVSTSIQNSVYAFLLLSLTISVVGDALVELKDDQTDPDTFLNLGMIMFAAHKVFNFVALVSLIGSNINWVPFVFSGVIAIFLTVIIMFIAKMSKLDFKYFFPQVCSYFLVITYMATLSVWYAVLLPQILLFTIAMVCFLISDTVLLRMHLGEQQNKSIYFIAHNIFYYGAQSLIVAFLFFGFFSNF